MSAIRGWCPSLFQPMPSGDGLLVRVRPPAMRLTADAAAALAEAVERYGNGMIELTRRGNLQIRGLSAASVVPFARAMVAAGLAGADAETERRRVVMCSPLAGDDPTLAPETAAIAAEIERGLIDDPCFAALPDKFAIVVDGGGVLPLDDVRADIRVRASAGGIHISFSGSGRDLVCDLAGAAVTALRFARDDVRSSPRRKPGSMRPLDSRLRGNDDSPPEAAPLGTILYPGFNRGAFGLGIPFGAMAAAMMRSAARLALEFGDGLLRTTPWRAFLVAGVGQSAAQALLRAARQAGFMVDPADPRRRVIACVGAPRCASASVRARADAALLAQTLGETAGRIHVAGCRKGCAHRGAADVTLIGERGRYALVRGGSIASAPEATGLTLAEVAARLQRDARQ